MYTTYYARSAPRPGARAAVARHLVRIFFVNLVFESVGGALGKIFGINDDKVGEG